VWPGFDPATAYSLMTGGPGAAPMHVASAAMSTLGGSTDTVMATSAVNTAATAENWSGLGQVSASASVSTLNSHDSLYAQLSLLKAQLFQASGELHTMTVPRMVTHVQANANRMEYVADNAINPWVLGALTPRLGELDTEYFGFMWPNNASAGLSYGAGLDALGAALSALSALPSLAGGSVAAPAMAAADVAANAGITMASAAMSTAEQAATAVMSPATASMGNASGATNMLGSTALSAPATPSVSPMANVQPHAPAMPSLAQAQAPAMSMFLPPPSAAVTPPAPATTPAPPVQTMTPSTGPGAAPPGVTSFMKPVEPFTAPPPPSGGQATGLSPGMLNAAALRGPVTTAPASTAVPTQPLTTSSLATATATQPLAYVPPDPTRPIQTPPPPQPPLDTSGIVDTLNPPPAPPAQPPSPPAPPPPTPLAPPQSSPPAPSDGPGTGGPGPGLDIQMLVTGLGGAPLAPPGIPPMPLDAPPTPAQIAQMNAQEAPAALDQYNADQTLWNSQCDVNVVGRLPLGPYNACLARLEGLNARRAAIIARLNQLGIPVKDLPPGVTAPPASVPGQSEPTPPTTEQAPPTTEQAPPQSPPETRPGLSI
jgi:hypothetical protein